MATQPEGILERNLVAQLTDSLGYDYVDIKDEAGLLSNLKAQLEKHNGLRMSGREFSQILNKLNKGGVFDRAKILRERLAYEKDDGSTGYVRLLNLEHWCQNEFQVCRQVSIEGSYLNRYDVTLLINGLPLVQIELKRRGLELKEAFNQINRYKKHSFWAAYGLFQYVQIFVISNGVNTKYFANNPLDFKFTNYWADRDNEKTTRLEAFADVFLEKCHVSKMICKYIVLHEGDKVLMVLRPYQFHAVEAIIERVQHSRKNGYIWHTTGSGKTLTSFKASQILVKLPKVHKVVFVVDRRDLDDQTIREFDAFQKGCVDSSDNTKILVQQFNDTYIDPHTKEPKRADLIVTTIQKLNHAIKNKKYIKGMEGVKDKRLVFIFDECHRSQFGETHKRIKAFFTDIQMFGFTGTPIFADNATRNELGKRTTKDLFDKCLHQYVITDAIRDVNVLRFSVEYNKVFHLKEGAAEQDIKVEDIDKKETFASDEWVDTVTDYIIKHHDRKTHHRFFSAIFCVSSIDMLCKYYDLFYKKKKAGKHDLRVATIFSYGTNEEDPSDITGEIPDYSFGENDGYVNKHTRDKMEEYIGHYNEQYKTKFNTRDSKLFYAYFKDIGKKLKDREKTGFDDSGRIDILLVVNMFLTGFDAKKINTLYVDKNLKHHGLIQAFSRTNRIIGQKKSHGFIVCFRNLKKATDEAVKMFSNKTPGEEILLEPYEVYVEKFGEALAKLYEITPDIDSVDGLLTEEDELAFVQAFRQIIRLKNLMSGFDEFAFADLGISEQEFEDFKSKYLDLYQKVKHDHEKEKVSILDDIDFEIELIQRVEINVGYIIRLLQELHKSKQKDKAKKRAEIMKLLGGEIQLRSKRELIEKFINEQLPKIKDPEDIPKLFKIYWNAERQRAFVKLYKTEDLKPDVAREVIEEFIYTGRKPLTSQVTKMQKSKPPFLERNKSAERIMGKIEDFVELFEEGGLEEE